VVCILGRLRRWPPLVVLSHGTVSSLRGLPIDLHPGTEVVGVGEHRWVTVGSLQRRDEFRPGRDLRTADGDVLSGQSREGLDAATRLQAQDLLDRPAQDHPIVRDGAQVATALARTGVNAFSARRRSRVWRGGFCGSDGSSTTLSKVGMWKRLSAKTFLISWYPVSSHVISFTWTTGVRERNRAHSGGGSRLPIRAKGNAGTLLMAGRLRSTDPM